MLHLIYHLLTSAGLTHAAALAMMGNWQEESGLEPNRLQGDFTSDRSLSRKYTADVMSGRISRTQFARDQKGYGLAQWTYFNFQTGQGRKQNLYDFCLASGAQLDDVTMQVSFALHELKTEPQYSSLWKLLQTTDDIHRATDQICRVYEQPYYNNVTARYAAALEFEKVLASNSGSEKIEEEPNEPPERSAPGWPPRTVDVSMTGPDVAVLQAVLAARGYPVPDLDGLFGSYLDGIVRQFQKDHALTVDGVVGPITWKELLKL